MDIQEKWNFMEYPNPTWSCSQKQPRCSNKGCFCCCWRHNLHTKTDWVQETRDETTAKNNAGPIRAQCRPNRALYCALIGSWLCCHPRCPPRCAAPPPRAARGTAVVPSLGRLQLSRPRGCCCCYTGARARAGAFVCCCCHRRSRLTIQMARPNSRELETRLLMLLYSMLHWHLDWTPQTQIHAVLQTLCLVWAFDLRYMLFLFVYLPRVFMNYISRK